MAFEDDTRDIDMLRIRGLSVGMGNAFPEVRAMCECRPVSNDQDGVALALEHVVGATLGN